MSTYTHINEKDRAKMASAQAALMRGLRGITEAYIVGKLFVQSELIYKHIHRTVKIGGLVVHKLKHSLVA